ncbi:hypothetical protein M9434_001262 [Picochlorum sp. BPE23]|nr:hypothetical protein M9434_001262 [Picochlorum sp. BPE23]
MLSLPGGVILFVRHVSKRTKRGLFAGKRVLSGNNVSKDGGNRTRRVWKPNAQNASLYSEILDRKVRFKVTPSALRSIDKAGGLDNYILYTKEKDLDSEKGLQLKMELLRKLRSSADQEQRV